MAVLITTGRTYGCVRLCVLLLACFALEIAGQSTAAVPTTTSPPPNPCVPSCECSSSRPTAKVTVDCSKRAFTEIPLSELVNLTQLNNLTISHL